MPSIEEIGEWELASPKKTKRGGGCWGGGEAAYHLPYPQKWDFVNWVWPNACCGALCDILDSAHFVLVSLGVDFDTNLKLG